jgi:hypothetical protein
MSELEPQCFGGSHADPLRVECSSIWRIMFKEVKERSIKALLEKT